MYPKDLRSLGLRGFRVKSLRMEIYRSALRLHRFTAQSIAPTLQRSTQAGCERNLGVRR